MDGVLTIKLGGKTHNLRRGGYVIIPLGTPHGQGNFNDKPVRFITTMTLGESTSFSWSAANYHESRSRTNRHLKRVCSRSERNKKKELLDLSLGKSTDYSSHAKALRVSERNVRRYGSKSD